ncbi:DUF1206 domain-containing protein [Rubrivirga sp.]|uniref:DUF1206 domain-containing protein n=1 Tax=Rubrivirga sp. TaxID=1885344 RepID=UPI003B51C9F5
MASSQHVRRHPLEVLGRVGYGVKGVLYAVLGVLALDAAVGPGEAEGQAGAFQTLAQQPFGAVLLWVLVVGLAAYAVWRVALAITDPEGEGDDLEGAGKRAFYVVSALAYGGLAYTAYKVVSGAGASGGGTEERAQTLLGLPGGRWIVGGLALALLGYGVYQFVRAYRASFMDHFRLEGEVARHRDKVRKAGQWGLSARGVVYVLTGLFMAQAALRSDADKAGGLDQALSALQRQPYGPWLLALVAVGFVMYGVYCGVNAAYRAYEGQ